VPELTIPDEHRGPLAKIAKLPPATVDNLEGALNRTPPTRGAKAIAAEIAPQLDPKCVDLERILETLMTLASVQASNDVPVAQFVKDVCVAMRHPDGGKGLTDSQGQALKANLQRLLSTRCVAVASKAADLQYEHEHVFGGARILTDVRPVFGEKASDIEGTVTTHILKIRYFDESGSREIYFGLDNDDLGSLRKVLDRAEEKTRRMKTLLLKTGVTDLDRRDK
jgi:hypothetical protein